MSKRTSVRRAIAVLATAALAVALMSAPASAWKPYTHNYTGSQVLDDLADGSVTINGHDYTVTDTVGTAITQWQPYYNAGVIGPDGFPDIAFGQATIHPGDPVSTGSWLGYLLQQAWAAQSPTSGYTDDERGQILAFTYGFLTHAAGDTWAHTLMNDFAGGVFPSVKEVLTKVPAAKIALRHLITEGYIGSATAGIDPADSDDAPDGPCNNPDTGGPDTICNPGTADESTVEVSRVCRGAAPNAATTCTTEGPGGSQVADYSANATPGIAFAVPAQFLQRTMVDLSAHTPADGCDHNGDGDHGCPNGQYDPNATSQLVRGPLLDAILDQEAKLQIFAAKERFDADHTMCSTVDPDCSDTTVTLPVQTVRGFAQVRVPDTICTADVFCVASPVDVGGDIVDGLLASYAEHWIDDINALRAHWIDFSLAVTKGLFDPQTRRDAANDACSYGAVGPESLTNNARNQCEAGVGALDSVLYALGHVYDDGGDPSFIRRYLLPALGLPDFVSDIGKFLSDVGGAIDDLFTYLGISNPIAQITTDVKTFVKDKINDWLDDEYGISPDAIEQFSTNMAQWMCGSDENNPATITIPGVGPITPGGLFTPQEHARLDALMHLPADHHATHDGLPEDCSPLKGGTTFDPAQFAPVKNTVTLAKLLLLDGPQLNQVLGTTLADAGIVKNAAAVTTYGPTAAGFPANVMVDGMTASGSAAHATQYGGLSTSLPWLHLIDGDHGWRANGLPRFCDNDGSGGCVQPVPAGLSPTPRALPGPGANDLLGQTNGGNGNFPLWTSCLLRPAFRTLFTDWENGAANFPDLGDTATPDASAPNPPSMSLDVTGAYTANGTTYVSGANRMTLSASDEVFTDSQVALRYRAVRDGAAPGAWQAVANGATFAVTGADGLYHVEYQAQDPCHTFDTSDALASPVLSRDVVLDTTGPSISISSPAPDGRVFDTAATSTITYTASDAASGVASTSVTLDDAPSSNNATLDMFFLAPGTHTILVRAMDNLGNASSTTRRFVVRATSASLLSNLDRARSLGLVPGQGAYNGLREKLVSALASHDRGQHATEGNQLSAFVNQLSAQRGKGIDPLTADRFTAYARDLITRQG